MIESLIIAINWPSSHLRSLKQVKRIQLSLHDALCPRASSSAAGSIGDSVNGGTPIMELLKMAKRGATPVSDPRSLEGLPLLHVRAFGGGQIWINDESPVQNWDGALPRQMAFYMIDHGLVSRDDFFGDFWPDLSEDEATNVFHVTKRKVTQRLEANAGVGITGPFELTYYEGAFYWSSARKAVYSTRIEKYQLPEGMAEPQRNYRLDYDVDAFEEVALRLRDGQEVSFEEVEAVLELYTGPFLQTFPAVQWVVDRRQELVELLVVLCQAAGDHMLETKPEAAEIYFKKAFEALKDGPGNEAIVRGYMKALLLQKRAREAVKVFTTFNDQLVAMFPHDKVRPSSQTHQLASEAYAQL